MRVPLNSINYTTMYETGLKPTSDLNNAIADIFRRNTFPWDMLWQMGYSPCMGRLVGLTWMFYLKMATCNSCRRLNSSFFSSSTLGYHSKTLLFYVQLCRKTLCRSSSSVGRTASFMMRETRRGIYHIVCAYIYDVRAIIMEYRPYLKVYISVAWFQEDRLLTWTRYKLHAQIVVNTKFMKGSSLRCWKKLLLNDNYKKSEAWDCGKLQILF